MVTARERARQAVLEGIDAEARRQLAQDGAAALSLRSIARQLGMVSSGIYRYVASRDDLLTRLIMQAYDELGAAIERAVRRPDSPRVRWRAAGRAARTWARRHPHEYALVYGSPVPGYAAPQDTVAPALRVYRALADPLRQATGEQPPTGPLAELGLAVESEEAVEVVLAAVMQVFGMISFELFGHTTGVVDDHDAFFTNRLDALADDLGL